MKFTNAIEQICKEADGPLTPQQIKGQIKLQYPEFYGTPTHLRNVAKGHYKDADHALLAQIYIAVRSSDKFVSDTSCKPLQISLRSRGDPIKTIVSIEARRYSFLQKRNANYSAKVYDILENANSYHEIYYSSTVFTGPSLYFHQKAISSSGHVNPITKLEYIYAVLTSWGMHRMGPKGSKMVGFEEFRDNVLTVEDEIMQARHFTSQNMYEENWSVLKRIFLQVRVMASNVSLVGNSKVMHHLLPNIIPPIDRSYTLRYLKGNTNVIPHLETEWMIMQDLIENFFLPIVSDQEFQRLARNWRTAIDTFPWDTSYMKIVDNLIIGAIKSLSFQAADDDLITE